MESRFCWLQYLSVLAQGLTSAPLTQMSAEQRCWQTGARLLPSLIGRCSSHTPCACRSVCFLLPTSSLCYRDSSSKNKLQAGSQLASLPILPAKATRPSLRQHSLMCESAVNSSPVPSIQVTQILAFIAVCCYLFSYFIYCFTLLVAFSFNGFVWHAANLLSRWPEVQLHACNTKGVSKSALTS